MTHKVHRVDQEIRKLAKEYAENIAAITAQRAEHERLGGVIASLEDAQRMKISDLKSLLRTTSHNALAIETPHGIVSYSVAYGLYLSPFLKDIPDVG